MHRSDIPSISSDQANSVTKSRRKIALLLFLVAILFLLAWVGIKAYRLATIAQSLLETKTELDSLRSAGLTQIDPDRGEEILLSVQTDVMALKQETAFFKVGS